jgi:hypothetical protein
MKGWAKDLETTKQRGERRRGQSYEENKERRTSLPLSSFISTFTHPHNNNNFA